MTSRWQIILPKAMTVSLVVSDDDTSTLIVEDIVCVGRCLNMQKAAESLEGDRTDLA